MAKAAGPASQELSRVRHELGADRLVSVYRTMVLARSVDERCLSLQRQGRIGFYVPASGQEAAQIGCAAALTDDDWLFPAYRELGLALWRGVPFRTLMDQFVGNSADRLKGRQMPNHYGYRDRNFVVASSPIGTQITQAVGAAMAMQRRRIPSVTVTFFGDGATSSNDFHAGMNFAGVYRTPTIFFCQNNQWAISLPREKQTRSATLAQKAEAYGFSGVVVDGTDVHAVFDAVSTAREHALAGEGPTLIEAQVYRFGPHSTSDDPRRYRTEANEAEWKRKDPVVRLREELLKAGVLTEIVDTQIREAVKREIAESVEGAEAAPAVDPDSLFDDTFAKRTPQLEDERVEFERLLREGVIRP